MQVTSERSTTKSLGFFSIMALSDAVTEGETCRSISPLSGNTLERSLRAVGPDVEASFFISPSNRQWITIRAYRQWFPHLRDHRSKNPADISQVHLGSMCR